MPIEGVFHLSFQGLHCGDFGLWHFNETYSFSMQILLSDGHSPMKAPTSPFLWKAWVIPFYIKAELQQSGCVSCPTLRKCLIYYKKYLNWWEPTVHDKCTKDEGTARDEMHSAVPRAEMQWELSDCTVKICRGARAASADSWGSKSKITSLFLQIQMNLREDQQTTCLRNCLLFYLKSNAYST